MGINNHRFLNEIYFLHTTSATQSLPLFLVIAGQSNAVGFGTSGNGGPGASDVPNYLSGVQTNAWYWRNVTTGNGPPVYGWQQYQAGLNSFPSSSGIPYAQFWGPEAQFAYQWTAAYPGQNIYMVKSALAGSQLEDTAIVLVSGSPTDGWCANVTGQLFDATISTIAAAISGLTGFGVKKYNSAILWMQGETDASDPTCAPAYYANLDVFLTGVRSEWLLSGSVPFIIGRIAEPAWQYAATVRVAEALVSSENPVTLMVSTDGFPLTSDSKHYIGSGQVLLGAAMYGAYLAYLASPSGPYGQAVTMTTGTSFTIQEQPANGTVIGTIAATNSPTTTPTYDLPSGQTGGLAISDDSAQLTVSDGTQLTYAGGTPRIFTVRASNGVNEATTSVTLNLTQATVVTDVANTVFRGDPNNSAFYTLVASAYSVLTDTEGSTQTMTQASANRRPLQAAYGGGSANNTAVYNSATNYKSLASVASGVFVNATGINYTIAAVAYPSSSGSGNAQMIGCVFQGAANTRLGLFYNFAISGFGVSAALLSNNAQDTANTTGVFPPGISYRVRLQKQGSTVNLYVNDVLQVITGFAGNTIRPAIMGTGETGAIAIGGNGALGGSFMGNIGLARFINGNPTIAEIAFLNNELANWQAGYTISGTATGLHGAASNAITVSIATGTFLSGETITISDGGYTGTFTPSVGSGAASSVNVSPASGASGFSFTYAAVLTGAYTFTFTNNTGWNNPDTFGYTAY
jgi:hypothetical protein